MNDRTLAWAAAAGAALIGIGVLAERAKSGHVVAGLTLVAASGFSGAPGEPLSATLTFRATAATQAGTVPVSVVLTQGGRRATLTATAQVPALAAGGSTQVDITTAQAIPAGFGGTVGVEVEAMSQTITGTLVIAAQPGAFVFGEGSVGTLNAQVGDTVQVSLPVVNQGGTSAVPTVTGTTSLGGTLEGHWTQTNAPSVAPGATAQILMETTGPIASQFGGDSLALSFTVTP